MTKNKKKIVISKRLQNALIKRSNSKDWNIAKSEWKQYPFINPYDLHKEIDAESDSETEISDTNKQKIMNIFDLTEYNHHHCICGQYIVNYPVIKNIYNGKQIIIGNSCIRHFNTSALNNAIADDNEVIFKELNKYNPIVKNKKKENNIDFFKKPEKKIINK